MPDWLVSALLWLALALTVALLAISVAAYWLAR